MKDPAFLFYANDFDSGTKFFSNEQVGMYVRILIAQHQHGRLTEKQIKHVSGGFDIEVMSKFKKDDAGLYYNERLEHEISKRKKYSDSRRKNVQKRYTGGTHDATHVEHIKVHMENENENENTQVLKRSSSGFFADKKHLSLPINDVQIRSVIEYVGMTKRKMLDSQFVLRLWEAFKVKEFTGSKWYNDDGAVFTHFFNSLKYEKFEDIKPISKPSDQKANDILKLTD